MALSLFHLLLCEICDQLNQSQQKLSLLCLQLRTDALKLVHGALILQVFEMSMELQNVYALVELSHPLLLGLKLIDVKLLALKKQVLSLVLGGLCSFQSLEGDETKANQILAGLLLRYQRQVVHLSKLREVFRKLMLESFDILADFEPTEVKIVAGHGALESESLEP